jgi:uncharacterized phiE125 gp8 family phage protein
MMMVELSSVASASLPVAELTEHLRLSSGFADDGSQDVILEGHLRAALSAIEARIGKAIYRRQFLWRLSHWHSSSEQALPIAPVQKIDSIRVISVNGTETLVPVESYGLRRDDHRPAVVSVGRSLPNPTHNGSLEIEMEAGFSIDWHGVPADLRQAVLLQAAAFYEGTDLETGGVPCGVSLLIEPYRSVRLRGVSQ